DVPLQLPTPWADLSFVPSVVQSLQTTIVGNNKSWFCGAGATTCPSGAVQASITSVLTPRSWPAWRSEGHLRFLRVRFSSPGIGVLSVRPDAQCSVVQAIRQAVGTAASVSPYTAFGVGRECDAQMASVEATPSYDMATWHLTELGLDPRAPKPAPLPGLVDVAVIDTGIMAPVAAALGVASRSDYHPTDPRQMAHGTGMALMVADTALNPTLHDFRALDFGGTAISETLARALDDSLLDAATFNASKPAVLTLCFGWPPELARPATISGGTCTDYENGFGEPIRYLLDVARRMDDAGDRAIFVSAAAGNRPLPVKAGLFPAPPAGALDPACDLPPADPDLYYPAQWARVESCRAGESTNHRVSLAVSAVDDRLQPIGLSIPGGETALVAPGQHVYASHPAASPTSGNQICGAGPNLSQTETLPRVFSGTSVSTALVAGAAARVQDTLRRQGAAALPRDALTRLLYLTGRNLCRLTQESVQVRVLDVGRLDDALKDCPELVECARNLTGHAPVEPSHLASCLEPLVACGFEPAEGYEQNCAVPRTGAVGWPAGYEASHPACTTDSVAPAWQNENSCQGTCPYALGIPRNVTGTLGPQPIVPTCPDCPALLDVGLQEVSLPFELTSAVEPGTTFTNPYLRLEGKALNYPATSKYYIQLPATPSSGTWTPGDTVKLTVNLAGTQIDWTHPELVSMALVMDVTVPGKVTETDFSTLRVEIH
ncbi:MAG: S8/S53 family peptidase, partial [Myxococcales bacterium]|nr:S8/S53 family peptidase [Myxococcales bacterium]